MLADSLQNSTMRFLFAVQEEEAAGYCCAQIVCGEAELLRIAVRKEKRGTGIGRCILRNLKRQLKEEGAHILFLEVREANLPARTLYRTEGFREIAIRKNYYGKEENAVVMECVLE